MHFGTLLIHLLLCELLQKKIMTKQKSLIHVLHKEVAQFSKGGGDITLVRSKP